MTIPVVKVDVRTKSFDSGRSSVYDTYILKHSIPLSEQVTESNTKYVVKWNYDLQSGTLEIPAGCILEFDGGKISNGKIVWNNTKVVNLYRYSILENIREEGTKIVIGGDI